MNKLHTYIFAGVFCILNFSHSVFSQNTVFPLYERWIEEDGTGFAIEIYRAVFEQIGIPVTGTYRPTKRAIKDYERKRSDCFLGGDEQSSLDYIGLSVIASEPIIKVQYVAYTLKNQTKIMSRDALEGKVIGIKRGVKADTFKLDGLNIQFSIVDTVTQNIAMLKSGRIDVFMSVYPDEKELINDLHFEPSLVLYTYTETLHCHQSPENKAFLDSFNKGLQSIKENGVYRDIYQKYY